MLQTYLKILFNEHKANETNYRKKLKAYQEAYPKFRYDSTSTTHEDNFNTSDFNYYEVGPSGNFQNV
jgi:hypothetical protein